MLFLHSRPAAVQIDALVEAMVRACVLAAILALAAGVPLSASVKELKGSRSKPVTLDMRHRVATAPASLMARVDVEPNAENRTLRVLVDGEGFYRSSDIQLDGLEAPRIHPIMWDGLPAGNYCVEAILFRATERVPSVKVPYRVLGPGTDGEDTSATAAGSCDPEKSGILLPVSDASVGR